MLILKRMSRSVGWWSPGARERAGTEGNERASNDEGLETARALARAPWIPRAARTRASSRACREAWWTSRRVNAPGCALTRVRAETMIPEHPFPRVEINFVSTTPLGSTVARAPPRPAGGPSDRGHRSCPPPPMVSRPGTRTPTAPPDRLGPAPRSRPARPNREMTRRGDARTEAGSCRTSRGGDR